MNNVVLPDGSVCHNTGTRGRRHLTNTRKPNATLHVPVLRLRRAYRKSAARFAHADTDTSVIRDGAAEQAPGL